MITNDSGSVVARSIPSQANQALPAEVLKTDPSTVDTKQIATTKLDETLKALGVNKESVLNLKALISSQGNTTELSLEALKASGLDPNTVALTQALESKDINKITQALQQVAEPSLENIKQQANVILEALKQVEGSTNNETKKLIVETFQKILPELELSNLDSDPKKAFTQLIDAFKSIGLQTKTTAETLEKTLTQFVSHQVDYIKSIEQSMRSILHGTQTDASIELLLRTLAPVVHAKESFGSDLGKNFVDFIKNLHREVLKAYTSDEPYPDLKKILGEASKQLDSKFTIEPKMDGSSSYNKPHPDIERPLAVQLRSISSQIKTLLTELEHVTKPADVSQTIGKLNEIISEDLIKQTSANPNLKDLAKELVNFKEVVKAFESGSVSSDKLKDTLVKLLNATQTTEGVIKAADDIKALISKDPGSLSFVKLAHSLENTLAQLSKGITGDPSSSIQNEIIKEALKETTPNSVYKNTAPLLSKEIEGLLIKQSNLNPEIKPIIDLLFQLNPSDLSSLDREALKQIADLIAGTSGRMAEKDVKDIKQAIKNLLSQYTDPSTTSSLKQSLSKDVLKQFEALVKGQELLSKINPIMNAAGDPVMILFPAIMGGLLANFETTFFPPVNNEEQNKKKKDQDKTEKAAISVNLPGLGQVSVEMSIKKNQPEVIFKVETDEVSEFMRSQLNSFAKRLATDFEDSSVKIETSPKIEVTPEWLKTLVEDAAIIA